MFKAALASLAISTAFAGTCQTNDGNCKAGACLPLNPMYGLAETCTECKTDVAYRGGDSLTFGPYGNTSQFGGALNETGGPTVCVEEFSEEDCQEFTNCEDCNANNAGSVITVSEDPLIQVLNIALINCLWCAEGPNYGCHKNLDINGFNGQPGARMSIVAPYPVDLAASGSSDCDAACQAQAAQVVQLLLLYQGTCPGIGADSARPFPFTNVSIDLPDASGCCATSGENCSAATTTAEPDGADGDVDGDGDSDSSSVLAIGASALLMLAHLF